MLVMTAVAAAASAQMDAGPSAETLAMSAPASPSDLRERGLAALRAGEHFAAAAAFGESAELGDAEAMRLLGDLAYAGRGIAQSFEQAIHWYCRAALGGDRDAVGRLDDSGLASWSRLRDAEGWRAACGYWTKPKDAGPVVEPPATEAARAPDVVIELRVVPNSGDGASSSGYWPWAGYPSWPWYRRPIHPPPHRGRPKPPEVPGLPSWQH
jgi:hypothetical protein